MIDGRFPDKFEAQRRALGTIRFTNDGRFCCSFSSSSELALPIPDDLDDLDDLRLLSDLIVDILRSLLKPN